MIVFVELTNTSDKRIYNTRTQIIQLPSFGLNMFFLILLTITKKFMNTEKNA